MVSNGLFEVYTRVKFALALKLNAKLWSQEKAFKKQARIEIVSTNDSFDMLK